MLPVAAPFHDAIARLLRGRLFLFAILLVCTVPLALLSPALWSDASVTLRFRIGYTVVFGGLSLFYGYGYWYNRRLSRRIDQLPIETVTGVARKVVQYYRTPIHAGGMTSPGPITAKMCQFLVIGSNRYAVPVYCPFDPIPDDRAIRVTFVQLGGPLIIKLRRIVLSWEIV